MGPLPNGHENGLGLHMGVIRSPIFTKSWDDFRSRLGLVRVEVPRFKMHLGNLLAIRNMSGTSSGRLMVG